MKLIHQAYERFKLYKANPCDVGAHPTLYPIQRALQRLASDCPCCNGARIIAAAAAGAIAPLTTLTVLCVLVSALAVIPTKTGHEEV